MNGASGTGTEYVYDANGSLVQDYNKKIAKIQYNLLNLPSMLQFQNGNTTSYQYSNDGVKRKVTHQTAIANVVIPMGSIQPLSTGQIAYTSTTDYCGNVIYEDGILSKILTSEGYITLSGTTPTYHYYLKDHLGNNRVVIDQNGSVEQVNHYYPFGGLFGEGTSNTNQAYKYNGKELDRMHGLDWYDYGTRNYDTALPVWTTVDPLAEKYYNSSTYAYCANNPIRYIDPDGRFPVWAVVGAGLEYGFQVYDNYKSGKSGYDALIGNIDFVDVGLSAINPMGKFKVAKTLLVEGAKAVIDITTNEGVNMNTNVEEVATTTIVNTVVDVGVGKITDAGSKKAVQNANKEVSTANQKLKIAERQAQRHPNSINKAENVNTVQSIARTTRNKQVRTQMLNSTVGQAPNTTQKGTSVVTNRALKDDEEINK